VSLGREASTREAGWLEALDPERERSRQDSKETD
jgi:hypothetical protein